MWLLERRNGLARGIYDRLVADARFASKKIFAEPQYRLHTLLRPSGSSAYQLVFGYNSADLYGWQDGDDDFLLATGTSGSGVANLRSLLARGASFDCVVAVVGGSVLLFISFNWQSTPRRQSWVLVRQASR